MFVFLRNMHVKVKECVKGHKPKGPHKKRDILPESERSAPQKGYSPPILEFPHFLRVIGPKHIKIMMGFVPSAILYGLTSVILVTYMSDWRAVLQYLPYYNGKYVVEKEEENEKEEDS